MRGRIIALYQIVYMGTTPIGALIVGGLATVVGARSGLVLGAIAAVLAGLAGVWVLTIRSRTRPMRPTFAEHS